MTKYLSAKNGIEILHGDGLTQVLAGPVTPSVDGIEASIGSLYLSTNASGTVYQKSGPNDTDWEGSWMSYPTDVKAFIGLLDTPTSYSGAGGKYPRVSEDGSSIEFEHIEWVGDDPEVPLIPSTAISGTYFVNFEGGRLLIGATGNKPDLVYSGPIGALSFSAGKNEACYGSFKVPYAWNTNTDILLTVNFMNDATQTGEALCMWKIDYQAYIPGDVFSDKVTTIIDIDYTLIIGAEEGTFHTHSLILPNDSIDNVVERGSIVAFKFYRDGTDVLDTMLGDAILITLMIEMTTGQHTTGDG